jgi:exopolysaccharide production protein ExoQ
VDATKSQSSRHFGKLGQRRSSAPIIDKYALIPLVACGFSVIFSPLLGFFNPYDQQAMLSGMHASSESRIFWPAVAAISVVLAAQNGSRLAKLAWPPHIICLLAYLGFAGASVLWAFRPESSSIRFVQQVMVEISIVLPAMLAARTADIMRGVFLVFALALCLNVPFVLSGTASFAGNGVNLEYIGSPGYFSFKNYLGECAAIGFLLSLHEILHRGGRRVLGIIGVVIAIYLLFASMSKTALGLALVCPLLAGLVLITRKITGISAAIILLSVALCYVILSNVSHFNFNWISDKLYGDPNLSGRIFIWDFAQAEISQRPLLGWGYESFWLVPGSPAIADAPGWIKTMPNSHNGYYDTMLNIGYVGLALLIVFIIATLHAVGRVAGRAPARAWLMLSLALYVIVYNFLESTWMHGFEFEWLVFLILAAEIGRYCQPLPLRRATYRLRRAGRVSPGPSPGPQTPRLHIRLS